MKRIVLVLLALVLAVLPAHVGALGRTARRHPRDGKLAFDRHPVAIFLLVLAFNLVGDGLRDVLDPRLRVMA